MPAATLNKVLEKLQKNENHKIEVLPVRGPGKCLLVLYISCENITQTKMMLNSKLKKHEYALSNYTLFYNINLQIQFLFFNLI